MKRKLNLIEETSYNMAKEVIKIVEALGEQDDLDRYPGGLEGYISDKIKQLKPKSVRSSQKDDSGMRKYYQGQMEALEAVVKALQGDLEALKYL
jgi:hypothetical protein